MNNEILATIFIPVYNQEKLIIKALNSLPRRNDIEILILDDTSTDKTLNNIVQYKQEHPELNIKIVSFPVNRGLGAMKNEAFSLAKGFYIGELDSDDYVYTDKYNEVLNQLDKETDMIYMNLEDNSGRIFELTKDSNRSLCGGACKFIKRSFLGNSRCPEERGIGEDWFLNEELQNKPHTDKFTNIVAYHYNYPREGSLFDLLVKGQS